MMRGGYGGHGEVAAESRNCVSILHMEQSDKTTPVRTSDAPSWSSSTDLGAASSSASDWDLLTMNFDRGNYTSSGSLPDYGTPNMSHNSLTLDVVPEHWDAPFRALPPQVSSYDAGDELVRRPSRTQPLRRPGSTMSSPTGKQSSATVSVLPPHLIKAKSEPRSAKLSKDQLGQAQASKARGGTMSELPVFGSKTGNEDDERKVDDDYDLGKVCGKGAYSIIRHATHKNSGLQVVVKSCRQIQMQRSSWEPFLESVLVHQKVLHPRIIRIEDVYYCPTKVDMVLEHLEGGTLQAELEKRGRFSEEQASYIIHQLLEALDYLHEREIVHRDITLKNIMLEKKGELDVKVIDFNLAVEWDGFEKLTDQGGSVAFASPERLQGTHTEKADLWSVGVVAHMLLTGQPVYSGSEREVLKKAKEGSLDLSDRLDKCSENAQRFVRSLLTTNPVLRMGAEEALSHPWL